MKCPAPSRTHTCLLPPDTFLTSRCFLHLSQLSHGEATGHRIPDPLLEPLVGFQQGFYKGAAMKSDRLAAGLLSDDFVIGKAAVATLVQQLKEHLGDSSLEILERSTIGEASAGTCTVCQLIPFARRHAMCDEMPYTVYRPSRCRGCHLCSSPCRLRPGIPGTGIATSSRATGRSAPAKCFLTAFTTSMNTVKTSFRC